MEILTNIIYAIGLVIICGLILSVGVSFVWFGIIERFKKPEPFEETALGQKIIFEVKAAIDNCNTVEDAQVKVWRFCEGFSDEIYSGMQQTIISYFEHKFGIKNTNKNDVIKKELVEYLKENNYINNRKIKEN